MNNKGCQKELLSFADLKLVGLNLICIFVTMYDRDECTRNNDNVRNADSNEDICDFLAKTYVSFSNKAFTVIIFMSLIDD